VEGSVTAEILRTVGQIAGIGGLALGVLLLVFRDIVRKKIFPKLPPAEAYRLLRLITVAVWSVAIVGIVAWVYIARASASIPDVQANCGGVAIGGNVTGATITGGTTTSADCSTKPKQGGAP
jgi:hypothetical protein